jgi:DNA-binding transcriptional regulator YdaS (Cro superfamily)
VKLETYLRRERLTDTAFARRVGASHATIQRLQIAGIEARTASLDMALRIEKATQGAVKAEELPISKASRRVLKALRSAALPAAPDATSPATITRGT